MSQALKAKRASELAVCSTICQSPGPLARQACDIPAAAVAAAAAATFLRDPALAAYAGSQPEIRTPCASGDTAQRSKTDTVLAVAAAAPGPQSCCSACHQLELLVADLHPDLHLLDRRQCAAAAARRPQMNDSRTVRWGIIAGPDCVLVIKDFPPSRTRRRRRSPAVPQIEHRPSRRSTVAAGAGRIRRSCRRGCGCGLYRHAASAASRHRARRGRQGRSAEKTFTATVAGAEQVIAAARQREVFVMEAMWTRFQPAIVAARALIDDGAIGEVRQLQADLGAGRTTRPDGCSTRLRVAARCLTGVYVVSFAQYFLGTPDRIAVSGSLAPTGVDAEAGLLLGYEDGVATLLISLKHHTPGAARIQGTKGWIEVPPRISPSASHRAASQRPGT